MSHFSIKPRYRSIGYDYNAPTMLVEANTLNEAIEIAKNSPLGVFKEWTFHVEPFNPKKIFKGIRSFIDRTDSKSKSQEGKRKNKMDLSRPQRRHLRRKNCGTYPVGMRPKSNGKCW